MFSDIRMHSYILSKLQKVRESSAWLGPWCLSTTSFSFSLTFNQLAAGPISVCEQVRPWSLWEHCEEPCCETGFPRAWEQHQGSQMRCIDSFREVGWHQKGLTLVLCVLCFVACPWEEKLFCLPTLVEVAIFRLFSQLNLSPTWLIKHLATLLRRLLGCQRKEVWWNEENIQLEEELLEKFATLNRKVAQHRETHAASEMLPRAQCVIACSNSRWRKGTLWKFEWVTGESN